MLPPLAGMAALFGSRMIVGSVGVMFIGYPAAIYGCICISRSIFSFIPAYSA